MTNFPESLCSAPKRNGSKGKDKLRNKVHEVRQKILRHIVDRGTPERQYLPSIRTFEQTTGCSRQTVHLALRELVDAEVLTAVPRGGFRVCNVEQAEKLLGPVTDLPVAFVMPRGVERGNINPLLAQILFGAESAAGPGSGIRPVCLTLPWEADEKRFSLSRLAFRTRGIAGAMLVGPTPDFIAEKFIEKCQVPVVLVDNVTDLPGVTCVSKDNLSGAARAVRYLIERGHRRIGMISVRPRKMRLNERWAGFHAEMHRHGLLSEIAFVEEAGWDADTVSGGAAAAAALLRKGLNGATALLALNDNMALGAIQVFQAGEQDPHPRAAFRHRHRQRLARDRTLPPGPDHDGARQPAARSARHAGAARRHASPESGRQRGHPSADDPLRRRKRLRRSVLNGNRPLLSSSRPRRSRRSACASRRAAKARSYRPSGRPARSCA